MDMTLPGCSGRSLSHTIRSNDNDDIGLVINPDRWSFTVQADLHGIHALAAIATMQCPHMATTTLRLVARLSAAEVGRSFPTTAKQSIEAEQSTIGHWSVPNHMPIRW
jgi:hypothetical protein